MRRIQNYTPSTYASSRNATQPRQRNRNPLSCEICRRLKTRCNRARPCNSCLQRSNPAACTYSTDNATVGNEDEPSTRDRNSLTPLSPRGDDYAMLSDKMRSMERTIQTLTEKVNSASTESRGQPRQDTTESRARHLRSTGASHLAPAGDRFQGFLTSHRGAPLYYIGATAWQAELNELAEVHAFHQWRRTFRSQWNAFEAFREIFKNWEQPSLISFLPVVSAAVPSETDLRGLLPDKGTCDVLVACFLDTFNATHPVVQVDTFLDELARFWRGDNVITLLWLARFLLVIGMGLRLLVHRLPPGVEFSNSDYEGRKIIAIVSSLIFSVPVLLRRPDTIVFQILLLMLLNRKLDLSQPDGSDDSIGLLSLVSRVAFSMGLHRDPHIGNDISAHEAELRRKLWITYTFIELEHAVQTGTPYLLRDADFDTTPPLSEGEMGSDILAGEIKPKSWLLSDFEIDDGSYQHYLYRAMPIWSAVLQTRHSCKTKLSVDEIHQHNRNLQQLTFAIHTLSGNSLSAESAYGKHLSISMRRAMLDCFNNRMLMVLHRSLVDHPAFPGSRKVFVDCALAIITHQINLVRLVEESEPEQRQAWSRFLFSLLRCEFCHAMACVVLILKKADVTDAAQSSECDILLSTLTYVLTLWDGFVGLSITCIKDHMMYSALLEGLRESIRLARKSQIPTTDLSTPPAKSTIHAMQRGADRSLQNTRRVISGSAAVQSMPTYFSKTPNTPSEGHLNGTSVSAAGTNPEIAGFPSDYSSADLSAWPAGEDLMLDMDMDIGLLGDWPYPMEAPTLGDPDWWNAPDATVEDT